MDTREVTKNYRLSIGTGNNSIVPINVPIEPIVTRSEKQESSPDILLRLGSVTLELRNNAYSVLIENTLRALQNVR